jgi:hypothetical protein
VKIPHALDGGEPRSLLEPIENYLFLGHYFEIGVLFFVAVVIVLFACAAAGRALSGRAGRLTTRRALIIVIEDICATDKVVIFVLADFVSVAFFACF